MLDFVGACLSGKVGVGMRGEIWKFGLFLLRRFALLHVAAVSVSVSMVGVNVNVGLCE